MARRAKGKEMTDDIQFTMVFESNNDDGSANYKLDLNEYTTSKLVEIGVISLLKEHIAQEQAKRGSIYNRARILIGKIMDKLKVVKPAIKEKSGKVVPAKSAKENHDDIIKREGKAAKGAKRVFELSDKTVATRTKAAKVAKAAGEVKNPGKKLHSHELRKGLKK
jgi:hypothetical protein